MINGKDVIRILSDESKRNLIADIENSQNSPHKSYEAVLRDENFNVFYNAPCLVLICGSKDIRTLHVDCALAACYFMFSASARGLGTCWIGLGRFIHDTGIRDLIGIPHDHEIVAPIIIGYAAAVPSLSGQREPKIISIVS